MTDLSIIMPVYNAGEYLAKALESVIAQTYDLSKIELIAVDDGSTDGSGEVLDRYAEDHPFMRVVHQENTGTPSAPRNRGLGIAEGEYVFFLDSDDHLGEEAVTRMLAHAREWDSDVLLVKLVGVGGRKAPALMFKKNQPKADLYTSRVTWTLGPWKLFRRSFIEEHRLRFPEDSLAEDIVFVLKAYFNANVISVAADYNYYYYVYRHDGQNITRTSTWKKIDLRVRGVEYLFELIERCSDAEKRDPMLMRRLFRDEVAGVLRVVSLCPAEEQDAWFQRIRRCVLPFYNVANSGRITAKTHLMLDAMAQGSLPLVTEIAGRGADVLTSVSVSHSAGRTYYTYALSADPSISVTTDISESLPLFALRPLSTYWVDRVRRLF